MSHTKIIVVYAENHEKLINTLCGQYAVIVITVTEKNVVYVTLALYLEVLGLNLQGHRLS
jgi:hypothetical protein